MLSFDETLQRFQNAFSILRSKMRVSKSRDSVELTWPKNPPYLQMKGEPDSFAQYWKSYGFDASYEAFGAHMHRLSIKVSET